MNSRRNPGILERRSCGGVCRVVDPDLHNAITRAERFTHDNKRLSRARARLGTRACSVARCKTLGLAALFARTSSCSSCTCATFRRVSETGREFSRWTGGRKLLRATFHQLPVYISPNILARPPDNSTVLRVVRVRLQIVAGNTCS